MSSCKKFNINQLDGNGWVPYIAVLSLMEAVYTSLVVTDQYQHWRPLVLGCVCIWWFLSNSICIERVYQMAHDFRAAPRWTAIPDALFLLVDVRRTERRLRELSFTDWQSVPPRRPRYVPQSVLNGRTLSSWQSLRYTRLHPSSLCEAADRP